MGLWHEDRALCAFHHEIRLRPGQVVALHGCAAIAARADPSRLSSNRKSALRRSLSGDGALLAACESGDVYLGIAEQIGLLRDSMGHEERDAVRDLAKIIVLSIQYGAGAHSLAVRTGMTRSEAHEILARLRARFHRFYDFLHSVGDHAGLNLEISTCFDWRLKCPSGSNPRTIRNFPMQTAGSHDPAHRVPAGRAARD